VMSRGLTSVTDQGADDHGIDVVGRLYTDLAVTCT
jgi:hypothetical protein